MLRSLLMGFVVSTVLVPFALAGFFFDDIINSVSSGGLLYHQQSMLDILKHHYKIWILDNGRIFPISVFIGTYSWFFSEELFVARAHQLIFAGLNFLLWYMIVSRIAKSSTLGWMSVLLLATTIQFNPRWDGLSSFVAINQYVLLFIQLSLFVSVLLIDTQVERRQYLYSSLMGFLGLCALFTYEIGVLAVILPGLYLLVNIKRNKPAALKGIAAFAVISIVYIALFILARLGMVGGYDGITVKLSIKTVYAFVAQMTSSFPLAILNNDVHRLKNLNITVLMTLIFLFASCWHMLLRSNHIKTQTLGKHENKWFLSVIAIMMIILPSILIGISARYQEITSYGDPYIVIYTQYFGSALLMAIVIHHIYDSQIIKRRYIRATMISVISMVSAITIVANYEKIELKNRDFKYPRQQTELLIRNGHFDVLKKDAKIYMHSPHVWESSNNVSLCSSFLSTYLKYRVECITQEEFLADDKKGALDAFYFKRTPGANGKDSFIMSGKVPIFDVTFTDYENYNISTAINYSRHYLNIGNGFYGWEYNAGGAFSWAQGTAELILRPVGNANNGVLVSFTLHTTITQNYKISILDTVIFDGVIQQGEPLSVEKRIPVSEGVNIIKFETEGKFWKPEKDPRNLAFRIQDLRVK